MLDGETDLGKNGCCTRLGLVSLDIQLKHHINQEKEKGSHGREQCYYVAMEKHTVNAGNHDLVVVLYCHSLLMELNAHGMERDLKAHNMAVGLKVRGTVRV